MKVIFIQRVRILSGIFIAISILLVVRLYVVQIIHGDEYRRDATGQYVEKNADTEDRGDIFFSTRDGKIVAAAVMQMGWRIAIRPSDIEDGTATYDALNALTGIDRERFFLSEAKKGDPYEEVAFRVSDAAARAIRDKDIPGVILVPDQWRLYPAGELAAHTLGFVGYAGEKKVGVYGLERYFEDTLAHVSAGLYINPFAEIFTNLESLVATNPAAHKGSIITSIEPTVEERLDRALTDVSEKFNTKQTGGIIIDPKSGAIIAISVLPTFNPNTYNTVLDSSVFSNPLVENVYEFGSIMKPLTIAAAIDVGAITEKTTYNDKGYIMKSGKKVSNFDGKGRGVVDMQEVLNQSLNTGASFAVDAMGQRVFAKYVQEYGFGEKTGIDLPNEAQGLIGALEHGSDVDYASASFGQGFAVSPIAMVRALSALANNGAIMEPHVAQSIRYENGIRRNFAHQRAKEVLKLETVETVTNMLVHVFDTALLGGIFKEAHYTIAAKTGTAQIAIPGGGGYYPDRYLHSFFGYFPAHDAKFLIFLFALEPKREVYASHTLSQPFVDITKFLINYYNLPPDR